VRDYASKTVIETDGPEARTEEYVHSQDHTVDNLIKLKSGNAKDIEGAYDDQGNLKADKIIDIELKSIDEAEDKEKLNEFNEVVL
jgi:hypothetical protein